jgi:hypothetical protein
MGQLDAERAFFTAFAALGYGYVSYPNGPELNTPAAPIPAGTIWYELDVLYAKPKAVGIGSPTVRYIGLYQVTLRAPTADAFGNPFGTYAIGSAAETIAAAFKLATPLPYGSVVSHCEEPVIVHLGKVVPEWYSVVVRIPFWMDA